MNGKSDAIRPIGNNDFVAIGNGWNNSHFSLDEIYVYDARDAFNGFIFWKIELGLVLKR